MMTTTNSAGFEGANPIRTRTRTGCQPASDLADLIETWRRDTRLCDARSVRNRTTHMHHDKSPDQTGWLVEDPRYLPLQCDAWLGNRHLDTPTELLLTIAIATVSLHRGRAPPSSPRA